jgi:hypothetical protein
MRVAGFLVPGYGFRVVERKIDISTPRPSGEYGLGALVVQISLTTKTPSYKTMILRVHRAATIFQFSNRGSKFCRRLAKILSSEFESFSHLLHPLVRRCGS